MTRVKRRDKPSQSWQERGDGVDGQSLMRVCQPCLKAFRKSPEGLAEQAKRLKGLPAVSFGRVVTHPEYRRTGLGKALLNTIMQHMNSLYPYQNIQIGAQLYLVHFYKSLGFQTIGAEYLEDGIPHIHMICTPDQAVIAPQTSLKI